MLKTTTSIINASQITGVLPVLNGGTGVTTKTGTGNVVLSAAPTLSGDVTLSTGNIIQGTAAKGFNFTANTPQAGMTSELLNWYEEGTWTPNQGAALTVVGAFSSSGRYTRIGRLVTVSFTIAGATSVAISAGNTICTNLPFTSSFYGTGNVFVFGVGGSQTLVDSGNKDLYSSGSVAAAASMVLSATYPA